ncbi:Asp23/Gls24 family envelope stress response protein [Rathayibacter iranicus]|uniref:Asp23/Gls24 family envelope stress response protein n=2 Tax=Rathayibacter iranicus TaxID=59737 RepID=A0AAD1ADR3_9MICO|nr:Asp23/Gls24 family envelope stress response protein [Rathayibacter iranicus]AZZ56313.1 Asp23/Gls24 family envelope stress response protein [Rathayibacter iranicus]MWV32136.1 Asp23/Gls24 family envelope stress response protein [Rathayibacter iranicus NCPPB 2253 = VKM Ac-1602]PPI45516.1 Asp23/Gls24 family envelope stress response protein [Rathayibacter iranicus]PPI59336.1 Asp23/Gls24 family envelope stress response protein [Rathayibacter iranicus]PPI70623.1 Asp23/Gls24 family envelope stress 
MATSTSTTTATAAAGRTVIDDGVIAKIAGLAARDVAGVHALGGGAARAIGAIRTAIGNDDRSQGVKVEVGERQVAADVTIVAEYPAPLQDVAENVRSAVAGAIQHIVGMEVAEINVTVQDVHIPDDENRESESRVS